MTQAEPEVGLYMATRTSLREKEAKLILIEFGARFKLSEGLFRSKPRIEAIETRDGELIFVDDRPLILRKQGRLIPSLKFDEVTERLPKVVVDMGAVPHICNGADVMVKGIREIEGTFEKGELVLVVDEKYGKHLAIGDALESSDSISAMHKGKALSNLHFVGDETWETIKKSS